MTSRARLIETNGFPFEFLSALAKRESWRKEIHRPIYHVHKWWAKRLGSVFRGLTLGSVLGEDEDLEAAFFEPHDFFDVTVFDPFMGSGTTLGEAHKLGLSALGRDINPVAVDSVRVALGQLNPADLKDGFAALLENVGGRIRDLYRTEDSQGHPAEVLYYFWVMQATCPHCNDLLDLFPSWVRARHAYPRRKPEVQVLCPDCDNWFQGHYTDNVASCPRCNVSFEQSKGTVRGAKATCRRCDGSFSVRKVVSESGSPPTFRLYGKLILTKDGSKEYSPASPEDHRAYDSCVDLLQIESQRESFKLPNLELQDGYNTRQAIAYGFRNWRDFFNVRQLLALGWLQEAIEALPEKKGRDPFLTLFSGVLEFNNMFASYKGEGTGAVRHMFSHHILKPERTPIEANVWGTAKSSGSFAGLFEGRLLRAARYHKAPTELRGARNGQGSIVCSRPFSGELKAWRHDGTYEPRALYLSCGDSAVTGLASNSVDLVLTDPPFFDNVHYSELADFFFAWQQLVPRGFINGAASTRTKGEVQDTDAQRFSAKLEAVFRESHRVLKDNGLLVFTYHHSREDGWTALAEAILGAGFAVVNAHPLKAEMSVATPKAQAKAPIQLDIAVICRKDSDSASSRRPSREIALVAAKEKLARLEGAGLTLSPNDRKIVLLGQLLTTLSTISDLGQLVEDVEDRLASIPSTNTPEKPHASGEAPHQDAIQTSLFALD